MPECTQAEREYLDELRQSQMGKQVFYADGSAFGVMLKEWGVEPPALPTSKLSDFLASDPPRLTGSSAMTARIASLETEVANVRAERSARLFVAEQRARQAEAELAEERAKPKVGTTRIDVLRPLHDGSCVVEIWEVVWRLSAFKTYATESIAREHAKRMQEKP